MLNEMARQFFATSPSTGLLVVTTFAGLFGGFVRGYSGFGFALAAVPVLGLALPPYIAIPAVMPIELAIGLATMPSERRNVALRPLGWLVLGTLVGTPIGITFLSRIPAEQMRIFISLVVVLAVVILWRRPVLPINMLGRPALIGAGLISGLLNGGAAMSGPPAIIALLGGRLETRVARATLIAFVAFSAALGVVFGIASGLVGIASLQATLLLGPGAALGGLLGLSVFSCTANSSYHRASLAILLLVSLSAIGSAAFTLLTSSSL